MEKIPITMTNGAAAEDISAAIGAFLEQQKQEPPQPDQKECSENEGDDALNIALLRAAMQIAMHAHDGQTDRAGKPYIYHPLTVATMTERPDAFIAALLHDVMEDSDYTVDALKAAGIPEHILDALQLLTHGKDEPYMDYVRRIKANPLARVVKLADLKHNSDLSRLPTITAKDLARADKYRKAISLLQE